MTEEKLPEGKVRLDGRIVDRSDICFTLKKHPDNPNIRISQDGTIYLRRSDGSLKRMSPKKKKKR